MGYFVMVALAYGWVAAIFWVSLLLVARLVCAIFSSRSRRLLRQRWMFSFFLGAFCFLIFMSLVPVGAPPMRALKLARSINQMVQLQTAILAYETEYGSPPPTNKNAALIKILTGGKSTDNPRGIAFITIKPSDVNEKGEMVDSWQRPFSISMADPDLPIIFSSTPEVILEVPDR